MKRVVLACGCLALIFSCGCVRRGASPETLPSEPPVEIEVAQAFVSEGELQVKVLVLPRTELKTDEVVVTLRGLRDGQTVVEESRRLVEDFAKPVIAAGERAALRFSIEAAGLAEYQVHCSWGKDVAQAAPNDLAWIEILNVAVERTAVACEKSPCAENIVLTGSLRNASTEFPLSSIELALGVFWADAGISPVLPALGAPLGPSEERVSLPGYELRPGEEKRFRITLDRPLPRFDFGEFVPHLRFLRAEITSGGEGSLQTVETRGIPGQLER